MGGSETPVHVVIASGVVCCITCTQRGASEAGCAPLKWILELNTPCLAICHPGCSLLGRFQLEEEESNQRALVLLVAKALAFRAGKQRYLRGFSGHLSRLEVGFDVLALTLACVAV